MVGSPPDGIRAAERRHWDGIGVAVVLGCPQGCAWAALGDIQVTLGQYCDSIMVVLRWHLSIVRVASGQH